MTGSAFTSNVTSPQRHEPWKGFGMMVSYPTNTTPKSVKITKAKSLQTKAISSLQTNVIAPHRPP